MKKVFLTLVAFAMTASLMAQLPTIGIRVGMTASKLSTNASEVLNSKNRLGYQFGAFARLNLGKLYLQPELIYNHRSTKLEATKDISLDGANATFKVGSLDVPILLGTQLLDLKVAKLRIFAGPVMSFTTNKDVTLTAWGNNDKDDISLSDFNTTTWYVQAGAGVDFMNFTFDIRYEKGLSNLYSGKWEGFNDKTFDLKNNVWVFTLGLKII